MREANMGHERGFKKETLHVIDSARLPFIVLPLINNTENSSATRFEHAPCDMHAYRIRLCSMKAKPELKWKALGTAKVHIWHSNVSPVSQEVNPN